MTVEEIEILVTAKVEEALKQFMEIAPAIKKEIKKAQEAFSEINTKEMTNKIHQATIIAKNKIKDFKKSIENNKIAIKVTNEDAKKQISQLEKEINSLQEKINARELKLNITNNALDKIGGDTRQKVISDMPDAGNKAITQETYKRLDNDTSYKSLVKESDKLNNEIMKYNSLLDIAKSKMAQLGQQTSQTATTQNKLSGFFSAFKQKIEQVKPSISSIGKSFNTLPKITQNITNNIKRMSLGVKQSLGNILKYAGALFGLRSIYNTLKASASAWLSSQNAGAQQLSANMEYLKYSMGSVFAPVIETVINLVYKLMKAIQSLVYAFSGVNIFAKATASSMNKTAGSAKQTSKSLAGIHGEINNVSNNKDSGSGGSTSPSMDLSQMDTQMSDWITKLKEKLITLFEPIKNSWSTYGQPLIESIKNSFIGIKKLVSEIGKSFEEVWTNGTGEQTVSTILQIFTSIFNTIGNIHTAFANAWQSNGGTEIIQNLWNALNDILDIVLEVQKTFEQWTASESFQLFANSIISICGTLSYWFELITGKLKEIWDNGGKETFEKLLNFISKVVQAVDALMQFLNPIIEFAVELIGGAIQTIIKVIGDILDSLGGLLDFITGVFTGDWEKAWNGIKEFFSGIWNALVDLVTGLAEQIWTYIENWLNNIKESWGTIWGSIKQFASDIWEKIKNAISEKVENIKNNIKDKWDKIKTNLSDVMEKLKTLIPDTWDKIKTWVIDKVQEIKTKVIEKFEMLKNSVIDKFNQVKYGMSQIWNNIWSTIKGVINKIIGGVESLVNTVIRGLNKIIQPLTNVGNTILEAIGISNFSFSIIPQVSLPRLAKGGVLTQATTVLAGEYAGARSNPEIVTPQNILKETFDEVLTRHEWNNRNSTDTTGIEKIEIHFGSIKVAYEMADLMNQAKRRNGKALIEI